MTPPKTWIAVLAVATGAGCSPALDWREFVPEGSGVQAAFPCRPDRHARAVVVAGAKAQMDMVVCAAGQATYAISYFDVADPARVSATLADWRGTAVANVRGAEQRLAPVQIDGMTANDNALRITVAGRLPDGSAVQEHAAFFTHGLRVYQATVIGAKPAPQDVDTFFAALKFPQ